MAVLLLWIVHVISVVCLLWFCVRLFIVALWSPAGKGLTSSLSFVMSNCEFVTFPLVSFLIVSIPDVCPLTYFVSNTIIQSYTGVQCCLLHLENPTFYRACLSRCISVIIVVPWRQCISIHTFLCLRINMEELFRSCFYILF